MRVCIAIPSGDTLHADMAMSLVRLVNFTLVKAPSVQIAIINPRCSLVPKGRYEAVLEAIKLEADHLLFIDSDMTFPPDLLLQLLARRVDIVGIIAPTRREPVIPIGKYKGGGLVVGGLPKGNGLIEMDAVGAGVLLIDMGVIDAMTPPWFADYYQPEEDGGGKWIGEDYNFCTKARLLDFKVYADLRMSKQVGHIGTKTHHLHDGSH